MSRDASFSYCMQMLSYRTSELRSTYESVAISIFKTAEQNCAGRLMKGIQTGMEVCSGNVPRTGSRADH